MRVYFLISQYEPNKHRPVEMCPVGATDKFKESRISPFFVVVYDKDVNGLLFMDITASLNRKDIDNRPEFHYDSSVGGVPTEGAEGDKDNVIQDIDWKEYAPEL